MKWDIDAGNCALYAVHQIRFTLGDYGYIGDDIMDLQYMALVKASVRAS